VAGSRPASFPFTQSGPYRLYSTMELLRLPPPTWLIDGVIPEGGFVTLYAPPEHYKSFLALDVALSVAAGVPWQGKAVTAGGGFVIYIAAEGVSGLGKRALAWFMKHEIAPDVPDIAWLTESLAITADSEALIELLTRIEHEVRRVPVLIVIDTLARCFNGKEATELGNFVAGVDVLRHKFRCAVLVVHHTRLDASRERGGTELRAASDAMLSITKDKQDIVVVCEKMKDAEHFGDLQLQLEAVEGTESCVLVAGKGVERRGQQEQTVLEILARHAPCTWEQWKAACAADGGFAAGVFSSVTARATIRDKIEKTGGKWRVRA
jgi:hypothetical protein